MRQSKEWVELKDSLRFYALGTALGLIDAAFLALWIAVQWVVNNTVVAALVLTGIDKIVLTIFQILFPISTLAPIVMKIYSDIRIMWFRTNRKIRSEIQIGEYDEPDKT